ncbi:MAG: hypothetical protein OXU29_07710 [Gammaproteobacteria bacterium]|nr:hypothetical protein [Gammaproteobacteria bacterium]
MKKTIFAMAFAVTAAACTFHEPPSLLDISESRVIVRVHTKNEFGSNTVNRAEINAEANRGCSTFGKAATFVSKTCGVYYDASKCIAENHLFICQ